MANVQYYEPEEERNLLPGLDWYRAAVLLLSTREI